MTSSFASNARDLDGPSMDRALPSSFDSNDNSFMPLDVGQEGLSASATISDPKQVAGTLFGDGEACVDKVQLAECTSYSFRWQSDSSTLAASRPGQKGTSAANSKRRLARAY